MTAPHYIVAEDRTIRFTLDNRAVGAVDEDGALRSFSGPGHALDVLLAQQPLKPGAVAPYFKGGSL